MFASRAGRPRVTAFRPRPQRGELFGGELVRPARRRTRPPPGPRRADFPYGAASSARQLQVTVTTDLAHHRPRRGQGPPERVLYTGRVDHGVARQSAWRSTAGAAFGGPSRPAARIRQHPAPMRIDVHPRQTGERNRVKPVRARRVLARGQLLHPGEPAVEDVGQRAPAVCRQVSRTQRPQLPQGMSSADDPEPGNAVTDALPAPASLPAPTYAAAECPA
jgi:hypothetical protein